MKTLLGISLAMVMLIGTVPLGFSEPLRVQLEKGIETNQLQCGNPERVLVLRTNGNVACVFERTAERMGWEIINQQEIIDASLESKLIQNPTGYWIPISEDNREDFAKLFVNAAGDSLTGELGRTGYLTEYGHISDTATVLYLYDMNIEAEDRKKFTENFMDSMGFEYDDKDVKIRENRSNNWFSYSHEYSSVNFRFATYMDEIRIGFGGWTNHPELVIFTLSEETAIQKAYDFIPTAEHYFISESDGGKCDVKITEPARVIKYVRSGVPYYKIDVGHCTHSISYIISADLSVYVVMNGITGEDIHTEGGLK